MIMKVLLDECLPKKLKREISDGHTIVTVPEQGWASKKNGELLRLAASEFDVFITIDNNLSGSSGFKGISKTNDNRKPLWTMVTA